MNKTRLEAFSDGVLAIIITIMVLEIKIPHEATLHALLELVPVFICYLVSFVYVAIYWGNHHHLLHGVKKITTKLIWANMGLLFTLSLVPFSTGWMGESGFAMLPMVVYHTNLLVVGFAAYLLQAAITAKLPPDDKIFQVIKFNQKKTIVSVTMNLIAVGCAFFYPVLSLLPVIIVSVIWVVPDTRIEKILEEQ